MSCGNCENCTADKDVIQLNRDLGNLEGRVHGVEKQGEGFAGVASDIGKMTAHYENVEKSQDALWQETRGIRDDIKQAVKELNDHKNKIGKEIATLTVKVSAGVSIVSVMIWTFIKTIWGL